MNLKCHEAILLACYGLLILFLYTTRDQPPSGSIAPCVLGFLTSVINEIKKKAHRHAYRQSGGGISKFVFLSPENTSFSQNCQHKLVDIRTRMNLYVQNVFHKKSVDTVDRCREPTSSKRRQNDFSRSLEILLEILEMLNNYTIT